MTPALETLLLPFISGQIDTAPAHMAIVMNAQYHPFLKKIRSDAVQYFKPYADVLEREGIALVQDGARGKEVYDFALMLGTKSRMETEIYLARAVRDLKIGGMLVAAADNKEGASRLKKMLGALGFDDIAEQSKNKARVCWAVKETVNMDTLALWLAQDGVHENAGGFVSRAGIYGWDKIDKGSELLATHLPKDLSGIGADFGCGYGYLSAKALEKNRKIKGVDCYDADYRAVELCLQNLAPFEVKKNALWLDLTTPNTGFANKYEWIVMNPPFHEGKKADSDIGIAFIKNAHAALRRNGALWMVANNQLPYERILAEVFFESALIAQGGGFKVFRAVK